MLDPRSVALEQRYLRRCRRRNPLRRLIERPFLRLAVLERAEHRRYAALLTGPGPDDAGAPPDQRVAWLRHHPSTWAVGWY
jgi:hypothetical protein